MRTLGAVLTGVVVVALSACGQPATPPEDDKGYTDVSIEWYLGFPSAEENSIVWTIADGQVTRVETEGEKVEETNHPAPEKASLDEKIEEFISTRNQQQCPDANRVTVMATDADGSPLKVSREQCDKEGEAVDALLDLVEGGPA